MTEEEYEHQAFLPDAFVMLNPMITINGGKLHPDAGRIGKITSNEDGRMVVLFESDDLIGKSTFCLLPKRAWLPVLKSMVEEYEPRAKRTAFRYSEGGRKLAENMGWEMTDASIGASRGEK